MTSRGAVAGAAALIVASCALAGCGSSLDLRPLGACGRPVDPVVALTSSAGRGGGFATNVWGLTASGIPVQLTTDGRSSSPAYSATGSLLFYLRGPGGAVADAAAPADEVWLMDLASRAVTKLYSSGTIEAAMPSPDDATVAIVASPDARTGSGLRILLVDPKDTGATRGLTSGRSRPGVAERLPAWSPDGSQLAWVRSTTDRHGVRHDTVQVTTILSGARRTVVATDRLGVIRSLAWSPDGTSLLVPADGPGHADDDKDGSSRVYTVSASDGRTVSVTPRKGRLVSGAVYRDRAGTILESTAHDDDGTRILDYRIGSSEATSRTVDVANGSHLVIAPCART